MPSSYIRIILHIAFHVRTGGVEMREEDLPRIFAYIGGIVKNLGGIAIKVGGMPDHIHLLCSLPKDKSIMDFMRIVKAESSKWMKTLDGYYRDFAWQDGYGAFSVSSSVIDKTVAYIQNQKEHHRHRSFREELKMFLDAYGIEYDERYLK